MIGWLTRRIKGDHARHAFLCGLAALGAAHASSLLGLAPWAAALIVGAGVGLIWELVQQAAGGEFSPEDVVASAAGAAVVALATLA